MSGQVEPDSPQKQTDQRVAQFRDQIRRHSAQDLSFVQSNAMGQCIATSDRSMRRGCFGVRGTRVNAPQFR